MKTIKELILYQIEERETPTLESEKEKTLTFGKLE